jgi:hypothetical protein
MSDVASKIELLGFKSYHKGMWSFEDLHNGKLAFVTHTRRLGGMNPFSISQRDAEKWMIQMVKGVMPPNICMSIAAHGHTIRGTLDDEPFKVVNCPSFVTFQEYDKAMGNFIHYQTDIGVWFIFVTSTGRIRIQSWIYPPFIYNAHEDKIYEGNHDNQRFVDINNVEFDPYFKALIKDSKFKIAVTGDFHCGHVGAIAPPKFTYGGIEYNVEQTVANRRLYSYWENLVDVCKRIKLDEFWFVGDACDGTNVFADKTRRMLTTNLDVQKAMFIELFKGFY